MSKLFVLMFVWGPALTGYGLGWLVHHTDERIDATVVALVGVVLTWFTYRRGLQKRRAAAPRLRDYYTIGMASGAGIGLAIFVMLAAQGIG